MYGSLFAQVNRNILWSAIAAASNGIVNEILLCPIGVYYDVHCYVYFSVYPHVKKRCSPLLRVCYVRLIPQSLLRKVVPL